MGYNAKFRIIVLFLGFICFLNSILTLIYNTWTTKTLKILYNIFFWFLFLCYIYILFLELVYNKFYFREIRRMIYKETNIIIFLLIFFVLSLCGSFILETNDEKYRKYLKNCPYTISDLELNLHLERRCDLYNINSNSRYSYQYICSYNSAKEFKYKENQIDNRKVLKKLEKRISSDYVICLKAESLIKNNSIVNLFSKEYVNSDKYYCSRTNKPNDFIYIDHKDCNNKIKKTYIYIFNFIYFLQVFYIQIYMKYISVRRNSLYNFGNRNMPNFHQFNDANDETKASENSIEINNFRKENTINIIIENKEIFTIKSDIKKCITVNKSNIKNNFELDSLNISLERKLDSSSSSQSNFFSDT